MCSCIYGIYHERCRASGRGNGAATASGPEVVDPLALGQQRQTEPGLWPGQGRIALLVAGASHWFFHWTLQCTAAPAKGQGLCMHGGVKGARVALKCCPPEGYQRCPFILRNILLILRQSFVKSTTYFTWRLYNAAFGHANAFWSLVKLHFKPERNGSANEICKPLVKLPDPSESFENWSH